MRLSSPRGRIGYPAGAVTGSRWVAVGGSNPFPQGEAAWASAKTRAGVGTRNRKPECQGPALIPAGAALHLATWGPRDIEASGLSGPTPPPFPEEVGVVRVPKVKEGVSVASSPLLPFCILRGPQSPASFPPPNCHCKPEGNPKPHVHRRSLSQQEGVGEPRAPSAARSGSRSQWSALFIHGNFHSGAFRVGPTCGSDSSTGSELRILRASVSQP